MKRIAAAFAAFALLGGTAEAETLRLMTGPQGGVWVPLGGQLKDMFERAMPGVTVQTLPGAGIANVRGVDFITAVREGATDIKDEQRHQAAQLQRLHRQIVAGLTAGAVKGG